MEYISVKQFAEKYGSRVQGYLLDTCLTAQDQFKALLDYFKIKY